MWRAGARYVPGPRPTPRGPTPERRATTVDAGGRSRLSPRHEWNDGDYRRSHFLPPGSSASGVMPIVLGEIAAERGSHSQPDGSS